jgi:hypothetical protein
MPGIVLELQREALDKSVHISDLLRKALLVAKKLKIVDLESWILSELNGYTDASMIPDYRWVSGEIKSFNPYNGMWLPIMFHESQSEMHNALTKRQCGQAIAEIESLISTTKDGQLCMQYSSEVQAKFIESLDLDSPPVLIVPESRLHGIIDTVRTMILDWALKLEEKGIIGDNLSFSDEDRKAASHIVFNIGSMSNSQIQAGTSHSQQAISNLLVDTKAILSFIENTRKSILELNLEKIESDELERELDTLEAQAKSPKPKKSILHESLNSVRTILEGAAGNLAAHGLINVIKTFFM